MKEAFTKSEAAAAAGVTPRAVFFYTEEGIIEPEVSNPEGRGKTRLYSPENVLQIALTKSLGDMGINLKFAKRIMEGARQCEVFHPRTRIFWVGSGNCRMYLIVHPTLDLDNLRSGFLLVGDPGKAYTEFDRWYDKRPHGMPTGTEYSPLQRWLVNLFTKPGDETAVMDEQLKVSVPELGPDVIALNMGHHPSAIVLNVTNISSLLNL